MSVFSASFSYEYMINSKIMNYFLGRQKPSYLSLCCEDRFVNELFASPVGNSSTSDMRHVTQEDGEVSQFCP